MVDDLLLAATATPSAKVFGATSHDSTALLAAVRSEQERYVSGSSSGSRPVPPSASQAPAASQHGDNGCCALPAQATPAAAAARHDCDPGRAAPAHTPGHELLVEASGGGWVGALRRDSRRMYVATAPRGASGSQLHSAGAQIEGLFCAAGGDKPR